MSQGKMFAALGAIVVLGVAIWMLGGVTSTQDQSDTAGQEYSALTQIPAQSTRPIPSQKPAEPAQPANPVAVGGSPDSILALPAEQSGGPVPVGKLRAERFSVYGRPTAEFKNEYLLGIGFDDAEIAEVRERFANFVNDLREYDPEATAKSMVFMTPEERNEIRRRRERYLDDREYDAALMATRQDNRAYFRGPIPVNSAAARVGLQAGDELIVMNGIRIFDNLDFLDARNSVGEGRQHKMLVSRKGELFDVSLNQDAAWGPVQLKLARPLSEPIRP